MKSAPWVAFAAGAGGGALIGMAIWWYASKQLDSALVGGSAQLAQQLGVGQHELEQRLAAGREQLRLEVVRQVNAQLPNLVRTTMMSTLAGYGITPTAGHQLATVLDYADRVGII